MLLAIKKLSKSVLDLFESFSRKLIIIFFDIKLITITEKRINIETKNIFNISA
jgi:hypothetical protein